MSADTHELIQQSLQGDQRAFGLIVERYQGAVSAMAYSVTGNLAQSEDLAQEAFIIAWKKLGALQKHESLSAWLCGIARNLARDWMRSQAARPTVSMEHLDQASQPLGESHDVTQRQRERADLVWTALAEIPETYREPLILFYRQGESIRDIAEALELTEDNVKQRLSRGRKLLRAEVARTVEDTLTDTRPGKAFTAGVIAALPALYGANAGATERASTSAKAAASLVPSGWMLNLAITVALLVTVISAAIHWLQRPETSDGSAVVDGIEHAVTAPVNSPALSEVSATSREEHRHFNLAEGRAGASSVVESAGASLSGVVVYRDSGAPAPGMRVYLDPEVWFQNRPVTGADGRFSFKGLAPGEHRLLVCDARYESVPETTEFRSEFYNVTLAEGESRSDVTLDVPPEGIVLSGKISDTQTGEPIEGVGISAFVSGVAGFRVKSGKDGTYVVPGMFRGQWVVLLESYGPVFLSDSARNSQMVQISGTPAPRVDFVLDRGLSMTGRVVDETGLPVSDAGVNAELFVGNGLARKRGGVRSGAEGEFVLWGIQPGDRIVVGARKDDFASPIASKVFVGGQNPTPTLLTLCPVSRVSGRFVDQDGQEVEAVLWSRSLHPEGPGGWRAEGRSAAATFDAEFAQGAFELKGAAIGQILNQFDPVQSVEVGSSPVKGLVLAVKIPSVTGPYRLSGQVVDEAGTPLPNCPVQLGLVQWDPEFARNTKTSENGHFEFKALSDGFYEAVATPGDPFEENTRRVRFSPEHTREITIVARRSPRLRGHVADATTGKPLLQFTVEWGILSAGGDETRRGPVTPNIITESGEFSISTCLDLDWYLRVSAPGYAPQRVSGGPLAPGTESDVYTFNMALSRAVDGTVSAPEGLPVAGALVFVDNGTFRRDLLRDDEAIATTDDKGQFSIEALPEEATHLIIWKASFALARVVIDPHLEVRLINGGVIEGRLLVGGTPSHQATYIVARSAETGDLQQARVLEDGSYRLEDLMNTTYELQAAFRGDHIKGNYVFPEQVVAADGNSVSYDIDIPAGSAVVEGTVSDGGGRPSNTQW